MIFERVLRGVAAPTGLGRAVDAVLARGMAKSHVNRYQSVTDFADALRGALLPVRKPLPAPANGYAATQVSPADLRQLRPRRTGLAYGVFVVFALGALFLFEGGLSGHLGNKPSPPSEAHPVAAAAPLPVPTAAATAATTIAPVQVPVARERPVAVDPASSVPPAPTRAEITASLDTPSQRAAQVRGRELLEPRFAAPAARAHAAPVPASRANRARPRRPSRPVLTGPAADDDVMPLSETFDNR